LGRKHIRTVSSLPRELNFLNGIKKWRIILKPRLSEGAVEGRVLSMSIFV
jgi:hypothetical protein